MKRLFQNVKEFLLRQPYRRPVLRGPRLASKKREKSPILQIIGDCFVRSEAVQ